MKPNQIHSITISKLCGAYMSAIAIRHMLFAKWIVKIVRKTALFQRRCVFCGGYGIERIDIDGTHARWVGLSTRTSDPFVFAQQDCY